MNRVEVPVRPRSHEGPAEQVLVVTLTKSRGAELARGLASDQIEFLVCSAEMLAEAVLDSRSAAAVIEEDALSPAAIAALVRTLEREPGLAGFPFLILTERGADTAVSRHMEQELKLLPNCMTLERPERAGTLAGIVRGAVRARRIEMELAHSLKELERVNEALAVAEERNRTLVRATGDCVKLLDLKGRIVSMNLEGQQRLGIEDFETVRSRSWVSLWAEEHHPAAQEILSGALQGEEGRSDHEFVSVSRERSWWDVTVSPMRDSDGSMTHLLAVSREVTERKRAERALVESEKLAAVGRLTASISHEINNPLEAVTNLIYLAGRDAALSPVTHAYLTMADEELGRVSRIVGQTLRFHRHAQRPRPVTPAELLEPVLAMYRRQLQQAHVTIDVDARDNTPITCYEGDIRQVLNNLVGNAIDAMRDGGRLRIRTRRGRDWRSAAPGVRITIADTGKGMSPQVAPRIFEAFFTTKGTEGSGLGLWISHDIVKKHGGHMRVRSRDRGPSGTVFSLFLPAKLPDAAARG